MKKKVLFATASVLMCAGLFVSCMPDEGYSASWTFSRIVTIDTTGDKVRLKADCTGETFQAQNLTDKGQLSMAGLGDAKRAFVNLQIEEDASYKQTLTFLQGTKLEIKPVRNREITDSVKPLKGIHLMYIDGYTAYPTVWVSEGYLNVAPAITSNGKGKYYLCADKAKGDTLYLNLYATYEDGTSEYYDDLQCFDLRTLRDTTNADKTMLSGMREVLQAMDKHRYDSVCVMLVAQYATKGYSGNDTIVRKGVLTTPFPYNF